ncbi:MAG: ATP-binding protein [Planctomycetota bacterium]
MPRPAALLAATLVVPALLVGAWAWIGLGGRIERLEQDEQRRATEVLTERHALLVTKLRAEQDHMTVLSLDERGRVLGPFAEDPPAGAAVGFERSAAARIGLELEARGQGVEALPFLEAAAMAGTEDATQRLARARALLAAGRGEAALTALEDPTPLPDGDPLPWATRRLWLEIHVLAELGRTSEAQGLRTRAHCFDLRLPLRAAEAFELVCAAQLGPARAPIDKERFLTTVRGATLLEAVPIPTERQLVEVPGGGLLLRLAQDRFLVVPQGVLRAQLRYAVGPGDGWEVRTSDEASGGDDAARLAVPGLGADLVAVPDGTPESALLSGLGRGLLWLALLVFGAGNLLVWRTLRREERLARLRSDFVDLVSHELRTPLTALSLKAEMLAHGEVPPAKVPEYQLGLLAEVRRLSGLVASVLDFARLEKGRARLERRRVAARSLVAEGLREARPALELGGQRLEVDAPRELPEVEVDVELLARALCNLIENAAKYAPAGSTIRVTAGVVDGRLRLAVADEGPGIPRAERDRIFEPFARGRAHAAIPGTGLGLALVRQAVEAHGGTIAVEDRLPHGARFVVELPTGAAA